MKKLLGLIATLVAVIALASAAYWGLARNESEPSGESMAVASEVSSIVESVESSSEVNVAVTSETSEIEVSEEDETEDEDPAAHLDKLSVVRRIRFEDEAGEVSVLSDYVGEPIVVNIWASWCEPCQREMPLFQEAMDEYEDVQFVMLNAVGSNGIETKEMADAFMAEQGLDFPIVYDYRMLSQLNLGVTMLPTTLFIDAEGEIVYTQIGEVAEGQLQELIETYLVG